ncbi:kinase, galactokinase/mevalonate kinase [Candidatus Magnetobacterium bavaricum]|uniref:Kinase, galactokinase/mevalonate kinase n=1 Tax=Candidatus Magnetobacterium bavaricum TaxID=29290 RepID=A0A0F3GK31_9BACT|nr:kinase, galactokinase/mevalonate kinase [Candidatus Magnetobacterium bavaricum]
MIITRTPLRVSFAGGGSDLREFYQKNGYGAVISAAIQKYMYIIIHPYFHDKIRIKYSQVEDVATIDEIKHPIVRECLRKVQIDKGIEIASFADVPSGTGLGSSSSFTVGLLNALYAYQGNVVSKQRLASEACEIEIDILNEPIGKQDQYAAAYGSINYIRFNNDETVYVTPVLLKKSTTDRLEEYLCLYHIGGNRRAGDILCEQKKNVSDSEEKFHSLQKMVVLANELKESLYNDKIYEVGDLLHKGWLYKKELASGITNDTINKLYDIALNIGAKGGKLLGAGGTGFLLLYAENHEPIKQSIGIKTMPFKIDNEGTKIIFYD